MKIKSEAKIQQEIVQWFRATYPQFLIYSVPNGVPVSLPQRIIAQIINKHKEVGMLSGVSDLIVHLPNRILFIEVKTETGKQSVAQINFQKKVSTLGGQYIVVRSLTQFQNELKASL